MDDDRKPPANPTGGSEGDKGMRQSGSSEEEGHSEDFPIQENVPVVAALEPQEDESVVQGFGLTSSEIAEIVAALAPQEDESVVPGSGLTLSELAEIERQVHEEVSVNPSTDLLTVDPARFSSALILEEMEAKNPIKPRPDKDAKTEAASKSEASNMEKKPKKRRPQLCQLCLQPRKDHICTHGRISIEKINLVRPLLSPELWRDLLESIKRPKKREDKGKRKGKGPQKCHWCGKKERRGHDCPFDYYISHEMRQRIRDNLPEDMRSSWDWGDNSDAASESSSSGESASEQRALEPVGNNDNETNAASTDSPFSEPSLLEAPLPGVSEVDTLGEDATSDDDQSKDGSRPTKKQRN